MIPQCLLAPNPSSAVTQLVGLKGSISSLRTFQESALAPPPPSVTRWQYSRRAFKVYCRKTAILTASLAFPRSLNNEIGAYIIAQNVAVLSPEFTSGNLSIYRTILSYCCQSLEQTGFSWAPTWITVVSFDLPIPGAQKLSACSRASKRLRVKNGAWCRS